ncbi:MAG: 23S rRNA (adenine(2030)-N(6))-methyltransferase RlmJ [Proteobacteria bacterium]|nr:23S rRNA (adenine(2030)-N(6))-methyltransferase RlmJ [Pseudomonadota bacterium]
MKYRHAYHAGNFADVHKHITLLALLDALQRKDKGFLYIDTHAGRGSYDLSTPTAEAAAGVVRFLRSTHTAPELTAYAQALARWRSGPGRRYLLPGSPLLAVARLRSQDRAVLIELTGSEEHALREAVAAQSHGAAPAHARVERGNGYALLKALLPPQERRGLTMLDPPYEEAQDYERVTQALADGLQRFPTGVFAAWYPIKELERGERWLAACARAVAAPLTCCELWLYPRDSRVALNGSGVLLVNPPWQFAERARVWLPELLGAFAAHEGAGTSVRVLS